MYSVKGSIATFLQTTTIRRLCFRYAFGPLADLCVVSVVLLLYFHAVAIVCLDLAVRQNASPVASTYNRLATALVRAFEWVHR